MQQLWLEYMNYVTLHVNSVVWSLSTKADSCTAGKSFMAFMKPGSITKIAKLRCFTICYLPAISSFEILRLNLEPFLISPHVLHVPPILSQFVNELCSSTMCSFPVISYFSYLNVLVLISEGLGPFVCSHSGSI
jgi:hypothetical protein